MTLTMEEVYRVSRKTARTIGDRYLAQDIVQETALALFLHGAPSGGYVMRTTRNKHIDHLRREGRMTLVGLEEFMFHGESVEEEFVLEEETRETKESVQRVLALLSPVCRAILEDIGNGMTYEQISRKYKVPMGTVKSRLDFAKRRFRKLARQHGFFEERRIP